MAESSTIGKIVVQMLLDAQQYEAASTEVEGDTKKLGTSLERVADSVRGKLAGAMEAAAGAATALADAQKQVEAQLGLTGKAAEAAAAKLVREAQRAASVAAREAQARADAEAQAARDAADAQVREQQRLNDLIYRLEQRSSTDVQKLEREKAKVLAGIARENGAERARIEQLYDAEITRAKKAEAAKVEAVAKAEADAVIAEQERARDASLAAAQQMGDGIRQRLDGLGTAVGNALAAGFAVAAAAVAGLATAATYTGATFQQKMQQVGVIAGATGDEFRQLEERARELGATTTFSAQEAAQAMQNLASAGLPVADVLRATGDALVLAGAGGTSLDTASAALTATLAQFSLAADQSTRVVDVFARATAGSQFQVQDLADAMKYGGVVGAGFGWSLEETVAALAQFRDAGLEGSLAGTALRSALVGATTASKTNTDALAQYGLTMDDINPSTRTFAEILQVVGAAGMDTADVIKVFGAESGAVVATLAQQAAAGSQKYQQMLADLTTATGAASAMYQQMNATVTGSLAELSSAAEEFLLSLFDTYKGPLVDLLNAITSVVNHTVDAIRGSSGEIGASMADTLGTVTQFINDNAGFIAQSITGFVRDLAVFTTGVRDLVPYLQALLPLLDDIALSMGLVWVTTKVMQFASAVQTAITALGAMGVSVRALMATITAATGGTYALVAAIGTLVAGIVVLVDRYLDAESAAKRLQAAQDKLALSAAKADASRAAQLEALLAVQREEAKQQLVQEAASGQLTQARKQELEALATLTGATAQQMEATGQLVVVQGRLRTAASVAESMDTEAVAAFNQQVTAMGQKAQRATAEMAALEAGIVKAQTLDAGMFGYEKIVASVLDVGDASVRTIDEAKVRIDQLRVEAEQATRAQAKLQADYTTTTSAMLSEAAAEAERLARAGVRTTVDATGDKGDAEEKYVDRVRGLHEQLAREVASLGASDAELLEIEMQDRLATLRAAYAEQVQAAGDNAAEVARLAAQQRADELALLSLWAAKRQEIIDEQGRAEAEARAATEARAQSMITSMQREGMAESERLEAEKADALEAIAGASAEKRSEVESLYDAKIAAARDAEVADTEAAADDMAGAWAVVQGAVEALVTAIQAVGTALETAWDVSTGFVGFWLDALEQLTGFAFSLTDAMDAITTAMEEAQLAGVAAGSPTSTAVVVPGEATTTGEAPSTVEQAATDYVTGLVAGAVAFAGALAEAAPVLLEALLAGVPEVVAALVEVVPQLVAALAAAVPALVQLLADQVPVLIEALAAGLPQLLDAYTAAVPLLVDAMVASVPAIVDAFLLAIPTIISGFISGAATLIDTLLAEVPRLLVGVIQMLPGLVQALLAAVPDIIRGFVAGVADVVMALLEALPGIVVAVVDSLPAIIVALIGSIMDALPTIVLGLVRAVPKLVVAVVGGIPEIIAAVLSQLPLIVTTLVGMVPDLIVGLVEALPQLLPAIVALVPELIAASIVYLPQLIVALFEAFFVELPTQLPTIAVAIGKALVDAVVGAFDALVSAIGKLLAAAWEAITDMFGGDSGDKGGAYTGITYVPATMRMTLHPGEMVVPASRNPARARDRADPAVAGAGATGQGGGSGTPVQLDVLVDGRVVESVLMNAQRRGTATKLTRFVRTTAGVQAGLDRGRFNRWSK